VNNFGMMLVIGLALLAVVVAIGIASFFVHKSYNAFRSYQKIKEKIFYNTFIRFMIQSVLKTGLASAATLSVVAWAHFNFSVGLSVVIAGSTLLVFGISPVIFGLILKKNLSILPRPSTNKKIGTLYLAI